MRASFRKSIEDIFEILGPKFWVQRSAIRLFVGDRGNKELVLFLPFPILTIHILEAFLALIKY